jgi:hypothetical protein
MSDGINEHMESVIKPVLPGMRDYAAVASELCEKALHDAKSQLHPLLHSVELHRLAQRKEFLQNFRSALECRIARKLAVWQPGVQAIFRYDEAGIQNTENWDGSIRLLVKVPRLSDAVRMLGKTLDGALMKCLQQMGWRHFQTRQSMLEIHQVTPGELRHGVGYAAMFYAVYTVPVRIWPQDGRTR